LRPKTHTLMAVNGVSFDLNAGETLGIVGESGSGKSTLARALLALIKPNRGRVLWLGEDLHKLDDEELRKKREDLQIVFQDPFGSLSPRMSIAKIIEEGLAIHKPEDKVRFEEEIISVLEEVDLDPDVRHRYPHEFSGGQRQRIAIARALVLKPKLVVLDEPTSSLDRSVQFQVINLLRDLQLKHGLTYLFITHNLSVVSYLADRVAVMYLGRIVEEGPVASVLENPLHPYTRALLSAVPQIDQDTRREIIRLEGDMPSPANPPPGCHFHPRCPDAMPGCRESYPDETGSGDHHVRCFLNH